MRVLSGEVFTRPESVHLNPAGNSIVSHPANDHHDSVRVHHGMLFASTLAARSLCMPHILQQPPIQAEDSAWPCSSITALRDGGSHTHTLCCAAAAAKHWSSQSGCHAGPSLIGMLCTDQPGKGGCQHRSPSLPVPSIPFRPTHSTTQLNQLSSSSSCRAALTFPHWCVRHLGPHGRSAALTVGSIQQTVSHGWKQCLLRSEGGLHVLNMAQSGGESHP